MMMMMMMPLLEAKMSGKRGYRAFTKMFTFRIIHQRERERESESLQHKFAALQQRVILWMS
jgi:hypothetical protein